MHLSILPNNHKVKIGVFIFFLFSVIVPKAYASFENALKQYQERNYIEAYYGFRNMAYIGKKL